MTTPADIESEVLESLLHGHGVMLYSRSSAGTGTSASTSSSAPKAMTLASIEETIARIEAAQPRPTRKLDDFSNHGRDAFLYGISVRQNPLATAPTPNRVHKHRRGQTKAYHARIQKKWTKRYGVHYQPCVYLVDNGLLGGVGKSLVAHPSVVQALRRSLP